MHIRGEQSNICEMAHSPAYNLEASLQAADHVKRRAFEEMLRNELHDKNSSVRCWELVALLAEMGQAGRSIDDVEP